MTRLQHRCAATVTVLVLAWAAAAQATAQGLQTYRLNPVADTTIYTRITDPADLSWDNISDGRGESLWLSTTAGGVLRRALLRFDLSAIPTGQQVVSASLTLYESRSRADHAAALHRVLAPWGEGGSNGGNGGVGAAAQAGDATWRWRDYQVAEWGQRGGDFVAQASASTLVGPPFDFYSWTSTPGLVADVQGWLGRPDANHGWILLGDEVDAQNAKRFDSLQGLAASQRPYLLVQTAPVPEASSLAMLGAGLMGLLGLMGLRARRQRG